MTNTHSVWLVVYRTNETTGIESAWTDQREADAEADRLRGETRDPHYVVEACDLDPQRDVRGERRPA